MLLCRIIQPCSAAAQQVWPLWPPRTRSSVFTAVNGSIKLSSSWFHRVFCFFSSPPKQEVPTRARKRFMSKALVNISEAVINICPAQEVTCSFWALALPSFPFQPGSTVYLRKDCLPLTLKKRIDISAAVSCLDDLRYKSPSFQIKLQHIKQKWLFLSIDMKILTSFYFPPLLLLACFQGTRLKKVMNVWP